MGKLLGVSSDAKTIKGEAKGFLTGILYLAPAKFSGYQVCPKASKGCETSCLGLYAGRNVMPKAQAAKVRKTKWFFEDKDAFMLQLVKDILALIRKADREGMVPVVRLNGSSDIPWERVKIGLLAAAWLTEQSRKYEISDDLRPGGFAYKDDTVMQAFMRTQFYDYTKRPVRGVKGKLPANYHLTFSLAEDNDSDAMAAMRNGMNVAAVFHTVPKGMRCNSSFAGNFLEPVPGPLRSDSWEVIDGDATDLRFKDKAGVIVGLKAKGGARKDTTGFVR